tara:strand:+ start:771 stop:938 length:168 start_codon:yes stop_codon:yes gene_type:complete
MKSINTDYIHFLLFTLTISKYGYIQFLPYKYYENNINFRVTLEKYFMQNLNSKKL